MPLHVGIPSQSYCIPMHVCIPSQITIILHTNVQCIYTYLHNHTVHQLTTKHNKHADVYDQCIPKIIRKTINNVTKSKAS